MGFDTLKFVLPAGALKVETEFNLGFCKEIQRGHDGQVVHWDNCTKILNDNENPENRMLDISECRNETGYDKSHDCLDGIQDISKCMGGNIFW